jgi:chorismate mutase/prephenate dehydratase
VVAAANIQHGDVHETYASLLDTRDIQVMAEWMLPVHFCLIGNVPDLRGIHAVLSHPIALSQCSRHIDRLEREIGRAIAREPCDSSSQAVRLSVQRPDVAALGSIEAARRWQVPVLRDRMHDHPMNHTVFWVLGVGSPPEPGSRNKTLFLVEPRPGTRPLQRLLDLFGEAGVDIASLKQLPLPQRSRPGAWAKAYVIEAIGHVADAGLDRVYRAIRRPECPLLNGRSGRLLGSFPAFPAESLTFKA